LLPLFWLPALKNKTPLPPVSSSIIWAAWQQRWSFDELWRRCLGCRASVYGHIVVLLPSAARKLWAIKVEVCASVSSFPSFPFGSQWPSSAPETFNGQWQLQFEATMPGRNFRLQLLLQFQVQRIRNHLEPLAEATLKCQLDALLFIWRQCQKPANSHAASLSLSPSLSIYFWPWGCFKFNPLLTASLSLSFLSYSRTSIHDSTRPLKCSWRHDEATSCR